MVNLEDPTYSAITIKDGSYFIYKDSASNIIDSLWVSNYSEIHRDDWCRKVKDAKFAIPAIASEYSLNFSDKGLFFNTFYYGVTDIYFMVNTNSSQDYLFISLPAYSSAIFLYDKPVKTVNILGKTFNNVQIVYNDSELNPNKTMSYYDVYEGLVKVTFDNPTNGYHA